MEVNTEKAEAFSPWEILMKYEGEALTTASSFPDLKLGYWHGRHRDKVTEAWVFIGNLPSLVIEMIDIEDQGIAFASTAHS